MKNSKLLIIISSILVIVIGGYIVIKKRTKKEEPLYVTTRPIKKDLVQYINSSGRLKAHDQITIGSLVAGRIIKLHIDIDCIIVYNYT